MQALMVMAVVAQPAVGQAAGGPAAFLPRADPAFAARVRAAVADLPALAERAAVAEAAAARADQARSALLPRLTFDAIGFRSVAREFRSQGTRVEGLSPLGRADAALAVDQLLFDWGATAARLRAGRAGAEAAGLDLAAAREEAALLLSDAWIEVAGARAALALLRGHAARLEQLATNARARFERGVDSGGDMARANAYLASARADAARAATRVSQAEARFAELFGEAPGAIGGADVPAIQPPAAESPRALAARARAREAEARAQAARRDRLPRLEARVGGTGYDVLDGRTPDYDVRAQIVLRSAFSVGGAEAARAREAEALARGAQAAAAGTEAAERRARDAAAGALAAVREARPSAEAAFAANRRARDLFTEQARVLRGTPFDVLRAERDDVDSARALLALADEEVRARAVLLARSYALADALGVPR